MKIRAKHLTAILLAVLMITASLVIVSHAKQASKGNKGALILGWCYHNGRIFRASPSMCTGQKGQFFKNKKDAQAYLDAQAPGFCCVNGRVITSKKGDCLKTKGRFFKDKKTAASWCDLQQAGWCCLNGKILSMKKGSCLKKKGHFFSGKTEAAKYCRDHQPGWCCLDGKITKTLKIDCLKKKGKFFKDQKSANNWCKTQIPGYCCIDGKVLPMKKGDCLKRQGHFFKDKKATADWCDLQQAGWCCLNGKILSMKKGSCLKKKGHFFSGKTEAAKYCRDHQPGWCCLDGKVTKMLKIDCLKKKGKFLTRAGDCKPATIYCCTKGKISRISRRSCIKKGGRPYATNAAAQKSCGSIGHPQPAKHQLPGMKKQAPPLTPIETVRGILPERRTHGTAADESCFCAEIIGRGSRGIVRGRDARGVVWDFEAPEGTIGALAGLGIGHFYEVCGVHPDRSIVIGHPFIVTRHTEKESCTGSPRLPGGRIMQNLERRNKGEKKETSLVPVGKLKGTLPDGATRVKIPQGVTQSLDSGIAIVSPTSSDTIYAGRPMNVRFRFTREVEASEVTVYVKNTDTGAIVFTVRTSYHPLRSAVYNQPTKTKGQMRSRRTLQEVELTLPADMDTTQRYDVTVNHPAGVYGVSDIFHVREFSIGSTLGMTAVEVKPESLSLEPNHGSYLPGEEVTVRIHSRKALGSIYLSRSDTTMASWPLLWQFADGHQEYNSETGDHFVRVQLPDEDMGDQRWAIKALLGDSSSLDSPRFIIHNIPGGSRLPANGWEIVIPSPLRSVTVGQEHVPLNWSLTGEHPEERRESYNFRIVLLKGDSIHIDLPRESIRWNHEYQFEWNVPDYLPTGDDYRIQVIETHSGISATSVEFSVFSTISIHYDDTSEKVFDNRLQISYAGGARGERLELYLVDQHGRNIFKIGSARSSATQYSWLIGSRLSGRSQEYPVGYEELLFTERFAIRAFRPGNYNQWAQGPFFTIVRPSLILSTENSQCGGSSGRRVHWESNLDSRHLAHIDYIMYNYYHDGRIVQQNAIPFDIAQPTDGSYCFSFSDVTYFRNWRENISTALMVYIDAGMRNAPHGRIVSATSSTFEIPWRSFRRHIGGGGGSLE